MADTAAMSIRTGRRAANRVVTCLEALEMGYDFINTCSRCDYYMQNKALNNKAMTLPRSELSKMWQCTSNHRVGDLFHSQCTNTPYRPIKVSKLNAYMCSKPSSSSNSSAKRLRLFEPSPPLQGDENLPISLNQIGSTSLGVNLLEAQHESAIAERNLAFTERDIAIAERNKLLSDIEVYISEHDKAYRETEAAKADLNMALVQRDEAKDECNKAVAESEKYSRQVDVLKNELDLLKKAHAAVVAENNRLSESNGRVRALLSECQQKQSRLSARVTALENQQQSKSSMMVAIRGNPLLCITRFAAKLFPDASKVEQLTSIFDALYNRKKSFRKHVHRVVKPNMELQIRKETAKDIKRHFAPWRFLEVLDSSSQSLNQECYKAIYSVQKSFPKWAKVLPEVKSIQRAQHALNCCLAEKIPIHLMQDRETGFFDYRCYTDYILEKFGLLDIIDNPATTDPVMVAVTFDGGSVSRFLGHVTGGFKLVDKRCRNPKTGEFLFGESGNIKVQSHVHCFPIKIALSKDSKQLYQTEFADFFRFLKEYEREKDYRVKFVFPQDMSSIWKTTGRGGTAKVKTFPCYCCAVTTKTLVAAQPKSKCFRGNRCLQPECYHHSMICSETIESWAQQKEVLEREYPYLLHPPLDLRRSQVFLSSINELRDEQNPYDIEFQPRTLDEGRNFDTFLRQELGYRRLQNTGSVREKRQRLRAALEAEEIYNLMTKLVASFDYDSAFCQVQDAIPCVMHGGNRINEKLFMMVMIEAWDSCTSNHEREILIATVENYINTGVFGTEESRSQWKLPLTKDSELETVSFTAWRGKKVLEKLADLAQRIFLNEDQDRLMQWQQMLSKYLEVMKVAFRHEDFLEEEVEEFQDLVDDWFYHYVKLVGLPGITNYMHLLGAGHLYFYLKKWGNLYRYQQQGWEMKNSVIASFIFRRTRRGGAGGKHGPAHTSRVEPLLQWFRRSTAWSTGDAVRFFTT